MFRGQNLPTFSSEDVSETRTYVGMVREAALSLVPHMHDAESAKSVWNSVVRIL